MKSVFVFEMKVGHKMVIINKEKCIGCGRCVADCVARNIDIVEGKALVKGDCIKCGHCLAVCNTDAVSIPEYDMDDVEAIDECNSIKPEVFLSCIKSRRSIRDYTEKKVPTETLKLLAEAGRYTATANNGQFHKYIFVQEKLDKLKDMVWEFIDKLTPDNKEQFVDYDTYKNFLERIKVDASDDFLFRNAPAVLFIISQRHLDAGMAAQNIEMMATTMGLGVMFNGFLVRIADANAELKKWLGIENETICVCMLLGYPKQKYSKTVPRKKADVTIL